jgi:hypothetical protein
VKNTLKKILKEEYFRLTNIPKFEEKVLGQIAEMFTRGFAKFDNDSELNESFSDLDDEKLSEGLFGENTTGAGMKFYNSLISRGYSKNELFDVTIPVELLSNKKLKLSRQIDVFTKVPIDVTLLDDFIEEYKKAKEANAELYAKYQKWANWYTDFHNLIYSSLPETDANLFLAATAFSSANTPLDTNIFEAAKLYKAVKGDWIGSNATRQALKFVVNNVNAIDSQKDIDILAKLSDANCQYAAMLIPKRDVTDPKQKQVREITVSKSKLINYNNFVRYFIKRGGKLSKQQITSDLQSGALDVSGTKVYSFFLNLIDPDYEWVGVEGDENAKIQPATIDRWMIRLFFTRPLKQLIKELQDVGVVIDDMKYQSVFISRAVMYLFGKYNVRSNIVRIMNEKLKEHKLDLKAQQLQAFGWVKIREESGLPSADFASFEDVVRFTRKVSDRIDQINPELNFIKDTGQDVKDEVKDVLSTINLLSKIPRFNFKDAAEIERTLFNWKQFSPELKLDKGKAPKTSLSIKKGQSAQKDKFLLLPVEVEPGIWQTPIKHDKNILTTVRGISRGNVIKAAKDWINQHKPFKMSSAAEKRKQVK